MSENLGSDRKNAFKSLTNKGTQETLRQRRHEVTVELRKNKKEDQLFKRRNIVPIGDDDITSPLQENNGQSPVIMSMGDIVAGMNSKDSYKEFESVQAARKMLSKERNPPIDTMIGHGIVPMCVNFLDRHDE